METASILVCEDERLVARDIRAALVKGGYHVVGIASHGEEAIQLARETRPDIALMDIHLRGEMSGIDVAGTLVDELGIPSIYLTAYADEETLSLAKETQPLSYLVKPFDELELRTVLEVALHRHREQQHVVKALQNYIHEHCDPEFLENALAKERELTKVEEISSQFRIASNIAEHMSNYLELFAAQVEPVAKDTSLRQDLKNSLHGALVHHDRALQIVRRLLDCSPDVELRLNTLELDDVIHGAIAKAQAQVPRRIDFVECLMPVKLQSVVDRSRLEEALVDVLINAFQAGMDEPVLVINTAQMYEEVPERFNPSAQPGWYNTIEVTDFGKGIRPEMLEHIFEPCFRVGEQPFSNGLGLSLAYCTAQRHGGWLTVRSAPKTGTTVSFHLPSLTPPEEALNEPEQLNA